MPKVQPLANEFVAVYESPDPKRIFAYSPGLCRCPSGRLIATLDIGGPGLPELDGPTGSRYGGFWQGKVYTSDDHGKTWIHRVDFPFLHARPFVAGDSVYVLGHLGDLQIIRSNDGGEKWSPPARLTEGQSWHQSACNVHYARGCVYLVMEREVYGDCRTWTPSVLAPVLMRARETEDLARARNWVFASELVFRDAVKQDALDWFGVPFFSAPAKEAVEPAPGRPCAPLGWLETNIVQFVDPDHYWYDPPGKTFHLWMRAHTGWTGLAAVAKVVEGDDGAMRTMLETVPSGKKALYVPCPGGQMRFHILYDPMMRLYWLLSTQATDSMTRADRLPPTRFNLPNNERQRLQLHFSRNCIDWCFAGLVAMGSSDVESRHYASMVIDGQDLHVLSRSGDRRAHNPHDVNLITFHTVRDFRDLVY